MTDQRAALLRSILASPEEDLPRLVYADWCEENGESERAEFIRVGVELARTVEPPITVHTGKPCAFGLADPKCPRCKFGLDLMWQTETRGAIGRVGAGARTASRVRIEVGWRSERDAAGKPRLIFSRGFIASLTIDWASWLKHERALFWSCGQTVECPNKCGVDSAFNHRSYPNPVGWFICDQCKDGRIQRPFTVQVPCPDCGGTGCPYCGPEQDYHTACSKCGTCGGTGHITRSLAETCQPLLTVNLTTWPGPRGWEPHRYGSIDAFTVPHEAGDVPSNIKFSRVRCATCDGEPVVRNFGRTDYVPTCPTCSGRPLNQWRCPVWPGLDFHLPETNYAQFAAAAVRDIGQAMAAPMAVLGSTFRDMGNAARVAGQAVLDAWPRDENGELVGVPDEPRA